MNIGVFFGGKSPEHDVSIITGQLIISELKKMGKKVVPVYLDREGGWHIGEELGELKFFQEKNVDKLRDLERYFLDMENSKNKIIFKRKNFFGKKISIDIAFPAFHGSFGEDGTIQGFWEILGVPYVGCDVSSSAITFDKILTKLILKGESVPTVDYVYFNLEEWKKNKEEQLRRIEKLRWPLIIKPPQLGSSIGISKAKDKKELEFAIEVAFHYGERVLIEEIVPNLADVTCCLLGKEEPIVSLLQESVFEKDLFDFDEKYLKDGGAQLGQAQNNLIIPANLSADITKSIQKTALEVYKILGCSGISRIDFLLNRSTNEFFVSEVNPLPGTLYHHLWRESGIELGELLERLIKLAKEKHQEKQKFQYVFKSNVLESAKSIKLQIKSQENIK